MVILWFYHQEDVENFPKMEYSLNHLEKYENYTHQCDTLFFNILILYKKFHESADTLLWFDWPPEATVRILISAEFWITLYVHLYIDPLHN